MPGNVQFRPHKAGGPPWTKGRLSIGEIFQEWNMIGLVARWGHNTLLIALALMTCVLFFGLIK
jgi:hypothetical protein